MASRLVRIVAVSFAMLALTVTQGWAQTPPPPQPSQFHHRQGQSGPRFRHARPLMGIVASMSGGTVMVTTWSSGRPVAVSLTPSTHILSRRQGSLTDLRSGDLVRVVATKQAGAPIMARSIFDVPAMLLQGRGAAQGHRRRPAIREGLWSARGNLVFAVGQVVGAPANGTVTLALPAGLSLPVVVTSSAHVSRLVSLSPASLTAGSHILVRGKPGTNHSLTASTIFIVTPR
jgi:Domain of unknown function (DUF5666)